MGLNEVVTAVSGIYTGAAYVLTVAAGLLTIMVERFLYRRRGYKREALITAVVGWSYIVVGTLLYVALAMLKQWV